MSDTSWSPPTGGWSMEPQPVILPAVDPPAPTPTKDELTEWLRSLPSPREMAREDKQARILAEVWVVQESDWETEPVLGVAASPEAGIRMVQEVYKNRPDFSIITRSAEDGGVDITIDMPHGPINSYTVRRFEVTP